MFKKTLLTRERILGVAHPRTLTSSNNLGHFYNSQGRNAEAEPLYTKALAGFKTSLGDDHPATIATLSNLATLYAKESRVDEAITLLNDTESFYLSRLGVELYTTKDIDVRRELVKSSQGHQYRSQSLALAYPDRFEAQQLAAQSVLRFKGTLAEEEAWMARLGRQNQSPTLRELTVVLSNARRTLAAAYDYGSDLTILETLLNQVNEAELALGRHSRQFAEHLQVRSGTVDEVIDALPENSLLIDFFRFQPVDFSNGKWGEPRFVAVMLGSEWRARVVDLGSAASIAEQIQSLVNNTDGSDKASNELHRRLIEPLTLRDSVEQLFIAPDAELHMLPFYRLTDSSGQYLGARFKIRQIQSGRDLLRKHRLDSGKGLLALGGINYGVRPAANDHQLETDENVLIAAGPVLEESPALRTATAQAFRTGFEPLPSTESEARYISRLYQQARPAEAEHIQLWLGEDATEQRLNNLDSAPRVLHLATHGFYRDQVDRGERPMLLSGIALAGANEAVAGDRDDGVLYALEAQSLNLEGTELVVLSACETGQGKIDYGEGVYGLVRALRTAGARQVLMTLRPVEDASAERFMRQFYKRWLSQPAGENDPAAALDETRKYYIENDPNFDWSPYVLIGV